MKEIADNFAYFDKGGNGALDKKELRQCLASLGEDSTFSAVDAVLAEYDKVEIGSSCLVSTFICLTACFQGIQRQADCGGVYRIHEEAHARHEHSGGDCTGLQLHHVCGTHGD
jgi:hypothetical protein